MSAGTVLLDLFEKYNKIPTKNNINTLSLFYFSRDNFGLDLDLRRVRGKLTDCYVPAKKIIALSDDTFNNNSVAAAVIVSHELGHAIQHKEKPFLFNLYRFLGGLITLVGRFAIPTIIAALIMYFMGINTDIAMIMLYSGAGVLGLGLLFKLVTIPVEYSASKIALNFLRNYRLFDQQELKLAKKLTNAAVFTYIADFIKDILGINFFKRRM